MRKPSTEELSLVHEELFKLATEALQRGDEPSLPSWLQLAQSSALWAAATQRSTPPPHRSEAAVRRRSCRGSSLVAPR